jgi:hypothetical protein
MRCSLLACLALLLSLLLPGLVQAQPPRVKITGVRIGYTAAEGKPKRCKTGLWAPVYIDLQAGNDDLITTEYEVVVETTDSEDMQNVYVEQRFLPTLKAREARMVLAYVRIGNSTAEPQVSIRSRTNREVYDRARPVRGDFDPLSPNHYVYLTLGGPLRGLKRALAPRTQGNVGMEVGGDEVEPEENGNRRFAHIDSVELLPTSWFGYQSADLILLTTGSEKFVSDLNIDVDDQGKARLKALAEWVRRGGTLVVSVAHNHQQVGQLLDKMGLVNLEIKGQVAGVKHLASVQRWAHTSEALRSSPSPNKPGELADIELAQITPGKGVQVLAAERPAGGNEAKTHPVMVQAPCGLGRVVVLAFDVDQPPFTSWRGQRAFWETFRQTFESANVDIPGNPNQAFGFYGQATELATRLQDGLELFPDVPVISFGWVALFILIYIVIVGPLDYFFLKKVVKRLELTWITFPAVVIIISAVAYFSAYYLKGNDLRINKTDVVDIDLHQPHAYGTAWFTLFSPRIQNYTIGIEPTTPPWGQTGDGARTDEKETLGYSPHLTWMGRPENVYGGTMRGGSQGLFRRAYDYAPEATGLVGVPIQVWTTKSFAASWHRPLAEGELLEADLRFTPQNRQKVGGKIRSHLPIELQDVVLFYRGAAYNVGKLAPEDEIVVDRFNVGVNLTGDVPLANWFSQGFWKAATTTSSARYRAWNQPQAANPGALIKSVLFYGHPSDNTLKLQNNIIVRNSTLRPLDQRWRLDRDNNDEVILFGRAVPPAAQTDTGPAEDVMKHGLSPTRLWLGTLPGQGSRSTLPGTLSQETYVRVYMPMVRERPRGQDR